MNLSWKFRYEFHWKLLRSSSGRCPRISYESSSSNTSRIFFGKLSDFCKEIPRKLPRSSSRSSPRVCSPEILWKFRQEFFQEEPLGVPSLLVSSLLEFHQKFLRKLFKSFSRRSRSSSTSFPRSYSGRSSYSELVMTKFQECSLSIDTPNNLDDSVDTTTFPILEALAKTCTLRLDKTTRRIPWQNPDLTRF